MRTWPVYSLLCLTMLVAPSQVAAQGTPNTAHSNNPELRRQIEAVNRAMEAALGRGDLLGVAKFYADDAVLMGPRGERVSGRANIDRYWSGIANPRRWKLDVFDVGGSMNEAYQLGRSSLTYLHEGQERTSVTDFIVIWKRAPGQEWKIAVDMWPGSAPQ